MSKVYIINNSDHDFTKAEKFGELVTVTEGKVPIFKTDVMNNMLTDVLKDFTEEDYLLLAGPALTCIMAYQIIVDTLFDRFLSKKYSIKVLVFDAKEQNYIVRHLLA